MSRLRNARAGTPRPTARARDLGKRREGARGEAGLERDRRPGRRHGPRVGDGLRAEGRQRTPRDGHEPGPRGVPPVPEGDAPRPLRPALAGPRPVRAVVRPLERDPVHPALPRRLGPRAGGPQVPAHLGQQDAGPPRVRAHGRRRDHDRPARPGRRQRRRHGDGRPPRARSARPERCRGRVAVRPLRLRHGQRRRPRGGREQRGVVDRRHPAARQPHPHLRRQRDLDRGQHRDRVHRRRRGALRGLRLARPDGRLDPRRPRQQLRLQGGRPGSVRRDPQGPARHRPAELHPAPHDHRLAGAQPPEHLQGPRQRPRRRRGGRHEGDPRLSTPRRPSRSRPASSSTPARRSSAARRPARSGRRRTTRGRASRPPTSTSISGCRRGPSPPVGTPTCRRSPPTRRVWRRARPAARSSTRSPRASPSSGAGRPTWPSPTTRPSRARCRSCRRTAPLGSGRATRTPAGCCTSASASTPWARS